MSIVYNGVELILPSQFMIDNYSQYCGKTFHSLEVVELAGVTMKQHLPIFKLLCNCGSTVYRSCHSVINNKSKSCGCQTPRREISTKEGQLFENSSGEIAEVIKVHSAIRVVVKFLSDDSVAEFVQDALKKKKFKNRNTPSVYGVGFIGFGEYNSNMEHLPVYKRWQSMLQRCYDDKFLLDHPTYVGTTVCNEWHNFQNFAEWFYSRENYKESMDFELDKDLIEKGNKVYSPDNCCLIPQEINVLIGTNQSLRGNLPIGVIWHKRDQEYRAQMTQTINGKRVNIHILSSNDPYECFLAYKLTKEDHMKFMAGKFKDLLCAKAYEALCERTVDITD